MQISPSAADAHVIIVRKIMNNIDAYKSDSFINWEFSKDNPQRFHTQDEIVIEYIIPNLDKFVNLIRHFYVTKIKYTNVRLQVFISENNIDKFDYIQNIFSELKLINDPKPILMNIVKNYGPLEKELDFREFLTDITHINLDLHKNISQAKSMACQARVDIRTGKNIRDCLSKYFLEYSQYFKRVVQSQNDELFWERIQYKYNNKTPWDHFHFNPILGFDF